MDKLDKWLYFRTIADMADDDGDTGSAGTLPSSLCVPASSMVSIAPTSDTTVTMTFESARTSHDNMDMRHRMSNGYNHDTVVLTVDQGKTFEAMAGIIQAINSGKRSDDGFIVVADDCATTDSATAALADLAIKTQYIHENITACGAITCGAQPFHASYGIQEYFEVVRPSTADNNDVATSLAIKLPAQAVLLDAGLSPIKLATSNHGAVALEYHNAAIADDAASGGTEWVGADAANDLSIPDENCDLDATAGVVGKSVWSGNAQVAVARGTAETFLHVTAKEDLSSMTGAPQVGVYVKWFGLPGIVI
tara:strand:+ start:942 stop:1865 length:924 start_codon:yes stop_codon:yes gene_type:complete